jgi:hypothetical protein
MRQREEGTIPETCMLMLVIRSMTSLPLHTELHKADAMVNF